MRLPDLKDIIRQALDEDAAFHDVTTLALVPKDHRSRAVLLAKQDLILCGMPVVKEVFRKLDPKVKIQNMAKEGAWIRKGKPIARLSGKTRALLSGERVALNFLQHLSGVATLTRRFVDRVKGTKAKILDTRKTIPGLRYLEKYAVRTGGGVNHRMNLQSAAIFKDNHRRLEPSLPAALRRLRRRLSRMPLVVEVEALEQVDAAIREGVGHILLDNMSAKDLKRAVQKRGRRCVFEASGGITLKNVRKIARSGVDYISVGALTHSAPAVDISVEMIP